MKKCVKMIFSTLLTLSLIMSAFVFNVSAASVSVSGGNYEVGQRVSVPVKFEGDAPLVSVLIEAKYNASVLRLESVSGVDSKDVNKGNGTVKFIDENFTGGSKKGSYTLNFTAIAAGNSDISVSAAGSDGTSEFSDSKTAKITVTAPKPSSNANLSSIKLSAGSLSPEFNPNTLFYDVTVKYDVDEITISATKADGKSTYTGGGTFGLEVGEKNERVLTVTAEDGTKKTYIVYVKRMTEEETAAYEDEQRDANPLLVVINGKDYTISNDLTDVEIPAGFTQGTATRKESEITVLNDEHGKYQLCWLVNADGEGAFYSRDEEDNFKKLVYINAGGKMYIVESFDIEDILPDAFVFSTCTIDGTEIRTVNYTDENLKDFNIFSCYVDGKTAYYRLDTVDGTMQRAVDFDIALEEGKNTVTAPVVNTQNAENKFSIKNMNKTGILVLGLMVLIAIILIVLAIMIIIKIASPKVPEEYGYGDSQTNAGDFILGEENVEAPTLETETNEVEDSQESTVEETSEPSEESENQESEVPEEGTKSEQE